MVLDGNLKARLQQQISQESETIQGATREQLNAMRNELRGTYENALRTIEDDMQSQSKALAKRMKSLILWPSLIWVGLLLTLSVGAWGIGQYQVQQIQERQQTLNNLNTLGVEPVRQSDGNEFLLLPEGVTLSESRKTESGQNYVQLIR